MDVSYKQTNINNLNNDNITKRKLEEEGQKKEKNGMKISIKRTKNVAKEGGKRESFEESKQRGHHHGRMGEGGGGKECGTLKFLVILTDEMNGIKTAVARSRTRDLKSTIARLPRTHPATTTLLRLRTRNPLPLPSTSIQHTRTKDVRNRQSVGIIILFGKQKT